MDTHSANFERAVKLAIVTGLRAAMGPALYAAKHNRPEAQGLALAALGELVVDKLPLVPSRASLPMLVPRALAGAWIAREVMREDGGEEPWAPVVGAAVAAGAATVAPLVRATLRRVLGIPDAVLGLAEDYLALKLGTEALGMSMDDVRQIAGHSVDELKDKVSHLGSHQAVGAGSM